MTPLSKPVARATRDEFNVLRSGVRNARRIVVTLLPGDTIEFRELRGRERWLLNVDTAFKYAVRLKAFSDAAEKRLAKLRR